MMDYADEFLNIFFTHLSHLCFDKAKEHVERERELFRTAQSTSWTTLLQYLQQIILAEKSYCDLGCLTTKNKGFLRKDNSLRVIYESLKMDLKKMIEDIIKSNTTATDKTDTSVIQQITEFLSARIDLIDFYEKMYQIGVNKQTKFTEVHAQIIAISDNNVPLFSHISLIPIKTVIGLECEILIHLLGTLQELQQLHFLPCLTLLYAAHTRIVAWETGLQNRESWKLGFGASFLKNNPQPLLFQWLVKLKAAILSKFSLYFYNVLSQQTTSQEMRNLCSKQQTDYYYKIQSFHRRNDALAVGLIYDSRGSKCNSEEGEPFTVIVSSPPKIPPKYVEVAGRLIIDRNLDLFNLDKIVYSFNSEDNSMYIIASVEQRISILLLFELKKSEKDVYISKFVNDIRIQLRCSKIFADLKNSSK